MRNNKAFSWLAGCAGLFLSLGVARAQTETEEAKSEEEPVCKDAGVTVSAVAPLPLAKSGPATVSAPPQAPINTAATVRGRTAGGPARRRASWNRADMRTPGRGPVRTQVYP